MNISLEWLREYAPLDAPVDRLVQALVDTGTEVDRVHRGPDGVIVVRVVTLDPIPGKNVQLVVIDSGAEPVRVVTGATNLTVGDCVAWAPPGTLLPGWDQPIGVRTFFNAYESPGMLCSAVELGIGDDAEGIHILESGAPGQALHEALVLDVIFEVDPTTNRPDCLCHVGIARELAAALHENLRPPSEVVPETMVSAVAVEKRVGVTNGDPEGCVRFCARVIENVTVGPSPAWLQRRLRAVGQKSINNVVDVTNYVMLEMGQPLHAFDSDKFTVAGGGKPAGGAHVIVRRGWKGDTVACLDGIDRAVTREDLVVCSGEVPVSIAGIIGGVTTAVDQFTRNVLLESASWNSTMIRATSRRLGRRTEASALFEKELSDELPPVAVDRAARLIAELGRGHILHGTVDAGGVRLPAIAPVEVTASTISNRLGCEVDADEASTALARLGFSVEVEGDTLRVAPPYFRRDVAISEDVIEEVGRSIGYGRVPSTLPGRRGPVALLAAHQPLDERIRDVCIGAGFDEAITYSFVSTDLADRLRGRGGGRVPIPLRNPLTEEWAVLRTSLLPGLCQAVAGNIHHGVGEVSLFEVGRAFWEGERVGLASGSTPDGEDRAFVPLPAEPLLLALAATAPGDDSAAAVLLVRRLQSVLAWISRDLSGVEVTSQPGALPGLHPSRSGLLHHRGREVGVVGEVASQVAGRFDVRDRMVVAELQLDMIAPGTPRVTRYQTPAKFPAVVQDLAVVVAGDVSAATGLAAVRDGGGGLLENVELYDEYRGERIGTGRKSWTFRLTFRAPDHTLTGAEAQASQDGIIEALQAKCGAEIRG